MPRSTRGVPSHRRSRCPEADAALVIYFEGRFGCIGILIQWLVHALYQVRREESIEFTRAHLETSVLPDAKWERVHADARSGTAEFQNADGQNHYLSDLASMSTFVPKQPDHISLSPSTPPAEDGTTEQKSKSKGCVGGPSPRRDQVRTAQQEGETTDRSFAGSIQWEGGHCFSQQWKPVNARRMAQ